MIEHAWLPQKSVPAQPVEQDLVIIPVSRELRQRLRIADGPDSFRMADHPGIDAQFGQTSSFSFYATRLR